MSQEDLKVGHFYWCFPTTDPDEDQPWATRLQPARFAGYNSEGRETWHCLNLNDTSDWPMTVFGEIEIPDNLVNWWMIP